MLLGLFDPVVAAIIDQHVPEGGQVLDCGSFIGYVALMLARKVGPRGQVHCFEADPRVAERLRFNVALNDASWVEVNEAAVVDRPDRTVELALTDQLGWGSVGVDIWHASEKVAVTGVAIDDYVEARGLEPAFIKLDVEGAEGDALRGMTRTLAAGRVALLVEWIPWRIEANGHDPDAILELLAEHGYRPHAPALRGGRLELRPGTSPDEGEDVLFVRATP
jgi:FkbM family methyltransferase